MVQSQPTRRGRPRADEVEARKAALLDAAMDTLKEMGVEAITMSAVAARAGASKATLYAWFGSREGLLTAVVERESEKSVRSVRAGLETSAPAEATLRDYCVGLLTMLPSPESIALNRASMTSAELAHVLLRSGRHRVGPLVEEFMRGAAERGELTVTDPADAYRELWGLAVRDTQIRVLLGEPSPTPEEIDEAATVAMEQFMAAHRPSA